MAPAGDEEGLGLHDEVPGVFLICGGEFGEGRVDLGSVLTNDRNGVAFCGSEATFDGAALSGSPGSHFVFGVLRGGGLEGEVAHEKEQSGVEEWAGGH